VIGPKFSFYKNIAVFDKCIRVEMVRGKYTLLLLFAGCGVVVRICVERDAIRQYLQFAPPGVA